MMKRQNILAGVWLAVALLTLALVVGCATTGPNAQIKAAYDTVGAYTQVMTQALQRGRITPDQAAQASANAKKARDSIDTAAAALATCKPPCDPTQILNSLQPTLFELEKQLRAQQGAKP